MEVKKKKFDVGKWCGSLVERIPKDKEKGTFSLRSHPWTLHFQKAQKMCMLYLKISNGSIIQTVLNNNFLNYAAAV